MTDVKRLIQHLLETCLQGGGRTTTEINRQGRDVRRNNQGT